MKESYLQHLEIGDNVTYKYPGHQVSDGGDGRDGHALGPGDEARGGQGKHHQAEQSLLTLSTTVTSRYCLSKTLS